MNFNRFQTAVLVCFHRERLSLDLLSLWSLKAQLSKQPLLSSRRHNAAAAAHNPLAAFSISRLKNPKSLSAVVLERLSSASSLFSRRQRPCRQRPCRRRSSSCWPRRRPWQPFYRSQPSRRLKEVV